MASLTGAEALIGALPQIAALRGRTAVVKYGGSAMISGALKAAVAEDIVFMAAVGVRTVLVHGGGPEIDAMLKAVGKEPRFVNGLRYTDAETMDIVQMVLCGKLNKDICALLQTAGADAVGLCGLDGGLLRAARMRSADLGLVGEVRSVGTRLLLDILNSGAVPVIAPVALGIGEDAGRSLNVNADTAAAAIAAALGAEKLVLVTDVRGILADVREPESLLRTVARSGLDGLRERGVISGGMIPKAECCASAIDGGVKAAHIIDGRVPHAILTELFAGGGLGTLISP